MTAPNIKTPPIVFMMRHAAAIGELQAAADAAGLGVFFILDVARIDDASESGALTTALRAAAAAARDGDRAGFFKDDDGARLGRWMIGPDKDAIVAALAANPSGEPESLM